MLEALFQAGRDCRGSQGFLVRKVENKRHSIAAPPACSQGRSSTLGETSAEDQGLSFLPMTAGTMGVSLQEKNEPPPPVLVAGHKPSLIFQMKSIIYLPLAIFKEITSWEF